MGELSLTILSETANDAQAIERLHDRTFGPGRFVLSAYRLREHIDHVLDLSFTARIGTLLVGSVRQLPVVIGETRALLLGPLTVEPPFRGRGVGRALLERALKDAKAKGSQINFGSVGVGSAVHISAEKFRLAAKFEATHVPYRGGPEVIADILGGRIDFYFCPAATALPLIREGQVRALVVSTDKRSNELPDVPSMTEVGLKDGVSESWIGVFVPSKTSPEIVAKMHDAGVKVLAKPEMQAALKKIGVETITMEPKAMDELVAKEVAANIALLKDVK